MHGGIGAGTGTLSAGPFAGAIASICPPVLCLSGLGQTSPPQLLLYSWAEPPSHILQQLEETHQAPVPVHACVYIPHTVDGLAFDGPGSVWVAAVFVTLHGCRLLKKHDPTGSLPSGLTRV